MAEPNYELHPGNIARKLAWLRQEIRRADYQKMVLHHAETYLSPLQANFVAMTLLSLEITIAPDFAIDFAVDLYRDATCTDVQEWNRNLVYLCFALVNIFSRLHHLNSNTGESRRFHHQFVALIWEIFKKVAKIVTETPSTRTIPPLEALSLKHVLHSLNSNSLRNEFLKKLLGQHPVRTLSFPLGILPSTPYLNLNKFDTCTSISHQLSNNLTCFQPGRYESAHTEGHVCMFCDEIKPEIPIDFCLHQCDTCPSLCQCDPCDLCLDSSYSNNNYWFLCSVDFEDRPYTPLQFS